MQFYVCLAVYQWFGVKSILSVHTNLAQLSTVTARQAILAGTPVMVGQVYF